MDAGKLAMEMLGLMVVVLIFSALAPSMVSAITGINYTALGSLGTALQAIFTLVPALIGLSIVINVFRGLFKKGAK